MKILIIGGEGRIATRLLSNLSNHDVYRTTRREVKDGNQLFLDLSSVGDLFLGSYDVLIVCACNFKRGRSDEEQQLCWSENVVGIKEAISRVEHKHVIYLSSYLSTHDNAYGRQKKEVEDYIKGRKENYSILRIGKVETDNDYEVVIDSILDCINGMYLGVSDVL